MKKALGVTELVTLISNFIAERFDVDTVAIIAAIFVQIGDTLATIAAVKALDNDRSSADSQNNASSQSSN